MRSLFTRSRALLVLAAGLTVVATACPTPPGGGGPSPNTPPTAVAEATPSSGFAPLTVEFSSAGSTDPDGTITSVSWNYGDGSPVGTADGPHTYTAPGNYVATLTIADNNGAIDTDTVAITVTEAPPGRYVATTGTDTGDCSSNVSPCLTINYAVGQADPGDTVFVAAGSYPEDVVVTKDLTLSGANAGIAAGTEAGARGPESVVRTIRTAADGVGTDWVDLTIDGFRIDPQGDVATTDALVPLVYLRGGDDSGTTFVNNVLSGGPAFVPGCTPVSTCGMAWTGLRINGGAATVSDNHIENLRYGVRLLQTAGGTPSVVPLVGTVERNVITGVTVQGMSLGGATGQQQPGATVVGNDISSPGSVSGPGGIVITSAGNAITGNTFGEGLGSSVYISLCKKWDTRNNTVDDNTFGSAGIVITTSFDGGQCITGTGGDTEGVGSWAVGGGRFDGFNANGNSMEAAVGISATPQQRWGTSAVPVTDGPIDVTCNWWNSATGPTTATNPGGTGASLTYAGDPHPEFTYAPWEIAEDGACTGTP